VKLLLLREEQRLRAFENEMLRRNRMKKWHNKKLHNLYSLSNIIRVIN